MGSLIENSWNIILFLIELTIILLLIDGIMSIICSMLGFSWKKVLMWAAAIFGILWLKDYFKKRKEQDENVVQVTDEDDLEIIEN